MTAENDKPHWIIGIMLDVLFIVLMTYLYTVGSITHTRKILF